MQNITKDHYNIGGTDELESCYSVVKPKAVHGKVGPTCHIVKVEVINILLECDITILN